MDKCMLTIQDLEALERRAVKDLENNTHDLGQEEIVTLIREFIRCKNDYEEINNMYKLTGTCVINKNDNKQGIILRTFKSGSIQVLEKIEPKVINTHLNFKTLKILDDNKGDINE